MRNLFIVICISIFIINPPFSAQSDDIGVLSYRKENARWGWYDYGDKEVDGKYFGEIKNLKPDGKGTYTYPDGSKLIGKWKNGKKDIEGKLILSD